MSTLDTVLRDLADPVEEVTALPSTHLTDARCFSKIAVDGHLDINLCRNFKEKLVYLFYGGVFYRPPSDRISRRSTYLPLAFVFSPTVLDQIDRYFPFDTGGIFANLYGPRGAAMQPVDPRFRVSGGSYKVPAKMVYHLFGTNKAYLQEEQPRESLLDMQDPCPDLFRYLAEPPCDDVDQRWRRIEALHTEPISVRHLLWVGFPREYQSAFGQLYEKLKPFVPQYYSYESYPLKRPSEFAAILQEKAHQVIEYYLQLP